MAFREVVIPEEQYQGEQAQFFKFNAIGDKIAGFFVSWGKSVGKYGGNDYRFRCKQPDGSFKDFIVTAPVDLDRALQKALNEESPPLVPGSKVIAAFVGTLDTGKESPMKRFSLKYDPENPTLPPAPKPAAAPKHDGDDIPF